MNSPRLKPYPEHFAQLNPDVGPYLQNGKGEAAFESMHRELDPVWSNCYEALRPGGFLLVNIGDATRALQGNFALYSNHARVVRFCLEAGFQALPGILWRKQTNAPNKFMGSGMLPAGAYITLEHEHILVFRKGAKRSFRDAESRARRLRSALFWEERNVWFSDVWFDIKGAKQGLPSAGERSRSAAFPLEFAHRLIHMFSVQGDTVLDPFAGTGTTSVACLGSGRHSVGFEIDSGLARMAQERARNSLAAINSINRRRLVAHSDFVQERQARGFAFEHQSGPYSFPVMTRQEKELVLTEVVSVQGEGSVSWSCTLGKMEPHDALPEMQSQIPKSVLRA